MNLRLRTLDFILTLQLQEAWSVATTFPVNMKAITQKTATAFRLTQNSSNYLLLILTVQPTKNDVNRLETKDM